jgi:REP element-mobilizing transposase RayT
MPPTLPRQHFSPSLTPWHITFGTYGTRLHGAKAPTVDKQHNQRPEPFLSRNPYRLASDRDRMKFPAVFLTLQQRLVLESQLPVICERGRWQYRICAAVSDHVHLLCDVISEVHGEKVRRLVKRWLGQSLSERWPLSVDATWWAEEGSNIAINDDRYLNNCFAYIHRQRVTPRASRGVPAPE